MVGVLIVIAWLVLYPATVGAWECQKGYADTKANQDAGYCVEATPEPTHYKKKKPVHEKPAATPIPATTVPSTVVPQVQPALNSAPAVPPTSAVAGQATAVPGQPAVVVVPQPAGAGQTYGEICHYEPTTGMWELRMVPDGNRRVEEQGAEWPIERGLCDQHRAVVTTPLPVSTPVPTVAPIATAVPTALPEPTVAATLPEPIPTEWCVYEEDGSEGMCYEEDGPDEEPDEPIYVEREPVVPVQIP